MSYGTLSKLPDAKFALNQVHFKWNWLEIKGYWTQNWPEIGLGGLGYTPAQRKIAFYYLQLHNKLNELKK